MSNPKFQKDDHYWVIYDLFVRKGLTLEQCLEHPLNKEQVMKGDSPERDSKGEIKYKYKRSLITLKNWSRNNKWVLKRNELANKERIGDILHFRREFTENARILVDISIGLNKFVNDTIKMLIVDTEMSLGDRLDALKKLGGLGVGKAVMDQVEKFIRIADIDAEIQTVIDLGENKTVGTLNDDELVKLLDADIDSTMLEGSFTVESVGANE